MLPCLEQVVEGCDRASIAFYCTYRALIYRCLPILNTPGWTICRSHNPFHVCGEGCTVKKSDSATCTNLCYVPMPSMEPSRFASLTSS